MSLTDVLEQSESLPPTLSSLGASRPCQMSCVQQYCYFKMQIVCQHPPCVLTQSAAPRAESAMGNMSLCCQLSLFAKNLFSVAVLKPAVGCQLGAHLFAHWVHVRALISSSSKPHWTQEQPAVQMIQVYLRSVLRKMQQKVVLCVPVKALLKGSGSLVDVPLWDSRRTQSPSMHPALLGWWPACVWTTAIYNALRKRVPISMQL